MENFIDHCNALFHLSDDAKAALNSILVFKSVKKGEKILKEGSYCKHLFFIQKGLVKLRFNANDGKEFIMRFFDENLTLTVIDSLMKERPSLYEIIALEDTHFTAIPFRALKKLAQNHPEFNHFIESLTITASINMMERISEMLEEDAKTRYSNFVQQNPTFLQRVSLGDISKYLGITQVSLSRIRSSK